MAATSFIIFITITLSALALLPRGSHALSNALPPSSLEPAAPPMETGGTFAPGPAEDPCLMALFNMSDCLTYVEQGSQLKTPAKNCCPELSGLMDSQPICLCKLVATNSVIGIQIDVQKALKLPSVCGLNAPPASTCSLLGFPVNLPLSPSGAPVPAPASGGAAPDGSGMDVPDGAPILAPPSGNGDKILSSTLTGISLLSLLYFIFFFFV